MGNFNSLAPILDAGCGLGATVHYLSGEKGMAVAGLDHCPDRIKTARTYKAPVPAQGAGSLDADGFRSSQPQLRPPKRIQPLFIQARLPYLPFKSGLFQGIFCECVLSLVQDKSACLKEFSRVLARGGKLVLSDLFLRGPSPYQNQGPPLTCLDGCLHLDNLQQRIQKAGLAVLAVEDHTRLLKEMACEMVFKYGSLANFQKTLTHDLCRMDPAAFCTTGQSPGYCLVIAQKPRTTTMTQP